MVSLYLIGIAVGCIAALVLNRTAFKGDPVPFIMELPNYRLPSVKTTVMLAWIKPRTLLPRPLPLSLPLPWSSGSFRRSTFALMWSPISRRAYLPVWVALSLRCWRRSASATGVIHGARHRTYRQGERHLDPHGALAQRRPRRCRPCFRRLPLTFLVFTLLYPPCVAAIGAVKGELGARYAVAVFAFQVTVALIVAFLVHGVGVLIGL